MNVKLYYYGSGGGEVQGPMDIDWIRKQFLNGQLPADIVVSKTTTGPWLSPLVITEDQPRAQQSYYPKERTISGIIQAFGYMQIGLGALCAILMLLALRFEDHRFTMLGFYSIGNLISGAFTLAFGEALLRLNQILDELRKRP